MTDEVSSEVLQRLLNIVISPKYIEKIKQNSKKCEEEYKRIQKSQTPTWEDMNKRFTI